MQEEAPSAPAHTMTSLMRNPQNFLHCSLVSRGRAACCSTAGVLEAAGQRGRLSASARGARGAQGVRRRGRMGVGVGMSAGLGLATRVSVGLRRGMRKGVGYRGEGEDADEEGNRAEEGDGDEHRNGARGEDGDKEQGRGWGQERAVPLGSVSPQPVVTQVMPPGKSSVASGRQTGDTRADIRAGVASLIRVMSSWMVSMLNLGFLKTWSGRQRSQCLHPWPGCWVPETPRGLTGTNGSHGD